MAWGAALKYSAQIIHLPERSQTSLDIAAYKFRMTRHSSSRNYIVVIVMCILQSTNQLQATTNQPDAPETQHLASKQEPTSSFHQKDQFEPILTSPNSAHVSNILPQLATRKQPQLQTSRRQSIVKSFLGDTNPQQGEDRPKVLSLIRGTREFLAPPSLNLLYNYINKGPETKKQKHKEANKLQIIPHRHTTNYQSQIALARPHPQHEHDQRAIALGRENEIVMMRPQLESTRFVAPLLMNPNGHELAASNMVEVPPMFEQTIQSDRHEQNLAKLYPEALINAERDNSDLGDSQGVNFENHNFNQEHRPIEVIPMQHNRDDNRKPYIYSRQIHGVGAQFDKINPHKTDRSKPDNSASDGKASLVTKPRQIADSGEDVHKNKERMLSNSQLVSLIDELKEFNSREASKIQSNGVVPPINRKLYSKYDEDSDHSSLSTLGKVDGSQEKQNNPATEEEEDNGIQDAHMPVAQATGENGKMSTDDLAKFARFLMTKEGANIKFQLALEKESPDDGDEEDDRDALLETKNEQQTAKPKKFLKKPLDEVDTRNSKAALQFDRLINNVAEKTGHFEHLAKRQGAPNHKVMNNDDTHYDHPRKGQNQDRKTMASASVETSTVENNGVAHKPGKTIADKDQEGNFAKMLIKQEILEDQQESLGSSPSSTINEKSSRVKDAMNPARRVHVAKKNTPDSSKYDSKDDRGEKGYQYPKKERTRDHITLIDEMQKTRKNKSNTRSRIHMPVDSILKRAMNGELGIQTERTSDGKLSLRKPNKDTIITLDLAKKSAESNRSKNDEGENDSELVPSQIEPDRSSDSHSVDRIHLQSQVPLKDEYPISERVSDRLNKLSSNLDRYFNDGFLQEIESKSKLDGDNDQGSEPTQPQPEPSNVNSKKSSRTGLHPKSPADDTDFDIDVNIDGKREKDDDYDREDGDTKTRKPQSNTGSNKDRSRKVALKGKKGQKKRKKSTDKESGAKSTAVKEVVSKKNKIELKSKSTPSNSDPVESESLETPIGPDEETSDLPETNAKRTKSSTESNISTSYKRGKKTAGNKFYEEPDWK